MLWLNKLECFNWNFLTVKDIEVWQIKLTESFLMNESKPFVKFKFNVLVNSRAAKLVISCSATSANVIKDFKNFP